MDIIEKKIIDDDDLTEEEKNKFLSYIVDSVKKIIKDDKMINKCDACQGIIGRYFDKLGIIYFACSTNKVISDNVTGHSFIVANISGTLYLIDPSFVQFKFDESDEIIIKNIKCKAKSPYKYMIMIDEKIAELLSSKGYIKLDNYTAFVYGNSFYLTKTNIPSNIKLKPFTGEVLVRSFMKGNEPLRNYGYGDIYLKSKNSAAQNLSQ